MEDEVKVTEMTVEEPVGAPTARQELETLVREILPEEEQTENIEQMAVVALRQYKETNDRLIEKMSDDPRVAQIFADVMNGKNGGASIVRHFGKGLLGAEEGSPEYEEMMAADKAFQDERSEMSKIQSDFDGKAIAWFDALDEYLERNNLDKEKYVPEIEEKVINPSLDLVISDELFARLVKAVDYDQDVEDAFKAGEVEGRNTNIHELKGKLGDGLPKGLTSQAAPVEQPKKRKMNSLLEKALNA